MKKKRVSRDARVASPCTQSWDEMVGNHQVRFCTHCAKHVTDLSTMNRREAQRFVRRSRGSICIRYIEHPETKAPVYADQFVRITRHVPLMAAGVMTASLSLSTLSYAQGGSKWLRPGSPNAAAERDESGKAKTPGTSSTLKESISGSVVDPNGAAVPNVTILLVDANGQTVKRALSDENGGFTFDALEHGVYSIRTEAGLGFAAHTVENVSPGEVATQINLKLEVTATVVVGGAIAVSSSSYERSLSAAVYNDEFEEARELLVRGEDPNGKEEDGTTAIFAAVENGNIEMVKLLLDFGAKVNVRNEDKETPLMMIDEETPVELVELLLRYGAKVNRVAKNGDTALIRAAHEAKPEVVKLLIDAGAELNVQNEDGMTALMNAADADNLENVRLLVLAGADVNIRDNDGDNAWDYTTEKEIEDFLVVHGIQLDPEDVAGEEESDGEETPEPDATPSPAP